jgi:hypothetical protein
MFIALARRLWIDADLKGVELGLALEQIYELPPTKPHPVVGE